MGLSIGLWDGPDMWYASGRWKPKAKLPFRRLRKHRWKYSIKSNLKEKGMELWTAYNQLTIRISSMLLWPR